MSQNQMQRPRSPWPLIMIGAGLVLLTGSLALNFLPRSVPATRAPVENPTEETYPEIPRASLAEAKAAYDSGAAVFVDVRDGDSYTAGHIPGALSMPLTELENRLGELNRSDWVITYCT